MPDDTDEISTSGRGMYRRDRDGIIMARLTIWITADQARIFRRYCKEHDRRQGRVIAEALELYFADEARRRPRRRKVDRKRRSKP